MRHRSAPVVAAFLLLLARAPLSADIPGATLTPIAVPSGVSFWHIAAAAGGGLWVSDIGNVKRLGRIAADGTFTGYPLTGFGLNPLPYSLTTGPDGNIWFTVALKTLDGSPAGGAIGRMTPSGTMTAFPVPTGNAFDNAYGLPITQGPDGNLWFCEQTAGKIAKITTSGAITEYQIPTSFSLPTGIAGGPDGNVWFTEYNGKIGRVTPSGVVTEFPVGGGLYLNGICSGPDGNLWFTANGTTGSKIGRVTPQGTIATFPVSTSSRALAGIVTGQDGNLYFAESNAAKIGQLVPTTGAVTESAEPLGRQPAELVATTGTFGIASLAGSPVLRIGPLDGGPVTVAYTAVQTSGTSIDFLPGILRIAGTSPCPPPPVPTIQKALNLSGLEFDNELIGATWTDVRTNPKDPNCFYYFQVSDDPAFSHVILGQFSDYPEARFRSLSGDTYYLRVQLICNCNGTETKGDFSPTFQAAGSITGKVNAAIFRFGQTDSGVVVQNRGIAAGTVDVTSIPTLPLTPVVVNPRTGKIVPGALLPIQVTQQSPTAGLHPYVLTLKNDVVSEFSSGWLTSPPGSPGVQPGSYFNLAQDEVWFPFDASATTAPPAQTLNLTIGNLVGTGPLYPVFNTTSGGFVTLNAVGGLVPGGTLPVSVSIDPPWAAASDGPNPHALLNVGPFGGDPIRDRRQVPVFLIRPSFPGAGTDRLPGSGRSRGLVTDLAAGPPGGSSFIIPTIVNASNAAFHATYRSDAWICNDGAETTADLYYTPDGVDGISGSGVLKVTVTLPAHTTAFFHDLVGSVFQQAGSGQLEIRTADPNVLSVRCTTEAETDGDPTRRFGTEIPTVRFGAGVVIGSGVAVVPGVSDDSTNRTNLILAETTGNATTVSVTVYDANGASVGSVSANVPAYGKTQINRLVNAISPGATLSGGWASVQVVSGSGAVVPVATVVDNQSNSFSAVGGRLTGGSVTAASVAPPLIVSSVARLPGALNTFYTTALRLVNAGTAAANLTLTYFYNDVAAGQARTATKALSVPARGALPRSQGDDAVASLFGLTTPTYGWIRIDGDVANVTAVAAVSSQVDPADPSKGLETSQVDGVFAAAREVAFPDAVDRRFMGVEKNPIKRTNLILVETGGQSGMVDVSLYDLQGLQIGTKSYPLAANQYLQITDVFSSVAGDAGSIFFQDATVAIHVTSGNSRVVAFASVVNNLSKSPEIFLLKPGGPP